MAFQQRYYNTAGNGDEMHASRHYRNPRKRKITVTGQSADCTYYCTSKGTTWEAEIHHFEKEAYTAVLKAFKLQADSISWEKESLISNLRQELRLSNEEHREILGKINMESCNQRIRESSQPCGHLSGIISAGNMSYDIVPHTISKGPLSKQSITQSLVPHESCGLPSASYEQPSGRQGLFKVEKHRIVVNGLTDPVKYPSSGPNEMGKVAFDVSSNFYTNKISGLGKHKYLLGQKVRTRWPHDHNFYDAVISRYDPARGFHALSFNFASGKDSLEWVDLAKIPPGDIQWVNDNPEMSTQPHSVSLCGTNISLARKRCNVNAGRGICIPKSKSKSERMKVPVGSGQDTLEIKIRKTDELLETVKRVFSAGGVDPYTVSDAKEVLKEHEKALIQVLESLADVSDDE